MTRSKKISLSLSLLVLLAGCGPPYGWGEHRVAPATDLTPRKDWKITGSSQLADPQHAIDSARNTRCVSTKDYEGAWLLIDLGKPCVFNLLVLEHGEDELGAAQRVSVLTSLDGKRFVNRIVGTGKRRTTDFPIITPTVARYVKLQVVRQGDRPWSVAEIYLK